MLCYFVLPLAIHTFLFIAAFHSISCLILTNCLSCTLDTIQRHCFANAACSPFWAILLLHWMKSSDNLIVAFLFVCIKLNIIDWQSLVKCISNKQKREMFTAWIIDRRVKKAAFRLLCFHLTFKRMSFDSMATNIASFNFWQKKKNKRSRREEQFDELDNEWWLIFRAKAKSNNWGRTYQIRKFIVFVEMGWTHEIVTDHFVFFFWFCARFSVSSHSTNGRVCIWTHTQQQ